MFCSVSFFKPSKSNPIEKYATQPHSAYVSVCGYVALFRVRIDIQGLKNETNPENDDLYGENPEISISGFNLPRRFSPIAPKVFEGVDLKA